MGNVLMGGVLSFFVTFQAIPIIIRVAKSKKLYDLPNERKIHNIPISSLGGVGIFVGFMLGFLLTVNIFKETAAFQYYLAAFFVVFIFGLKDDIIVLSPFKKIIGQLFVTAILLFKAKLLITNLHGFLGITVLPTVFSYLITAITIVVVMNAYNLIDGIDGLAGSIGVITSLVLAMFFFLNGDIFFATIGFVFAASLLAFLIANFSPAKIFMGDTGSMLSGVIHAILVIRFIETATSFHNMPVLSAPAMGFGILMLPLLDTLRVFSIRLIYKRSPFYADRNHLHHILLDRGFSHKSISVILSLTTILCIVLTYIALPLGTTAVIGLQMFVFFTSVYILQITKSKKLSSSKTGMYELDFGNKIQSRITFTNWNRVTSDKN